MMNALSRRVVANKGLPSAFLTADFSTQKRPISPHVTIYKFPLPAISSVLNRVCGGGLTVGLTGFSLYALGGSCDIPAIMDSFKEAAPVAVPVAKAVVGFPFVYHTYSAIRHTFWDYTAKGLDLASVELSSQVLVGASVATTLGL